MSEARTAGFISSQACGSHPATVVDSIYLRGSRRITWQYTGVIVGIDVRPWSISGQAEAKKNNAEFRINAELQQRHLFNDTITKERFVMTVEFTFRRPFRWYVLTYSSEILRDTSDVDNAV